MPSSSEQFCQACITGDLALIQELLKTDSKLVNCRGKVRSDHREFMKQHQAEDGWSPLHLAGHYGRLEVVKALIKSGADVDALAENGEGNTPLMAAVAGGKVEIVKELLERGADPLKYDADGAFNAVKLAEAEDKTEVSKLLREFAGR